MCLIGMTDTAPPVPPLLDVVAEPPTPTLLLAEALTLAVTLTPPEPPTPAVEVEAEVVAASLPPAPVIDPVDPALCCWEPVLEQPRRSVKAAPR
jgi:hypothetical protein